MSDRPLAGRVAVVTGAGRGIGAAIAESLAAAGAGVTVVARTAADVEAVAARIRASGGRAAALPADVTDEAAVAALAEAAVRALGPVDVLVNNAGDAAAAPVAKITLGEWNRLLAVNATAAFLTTRAFAPAMRERRFGRIVNVASIAGLTGAKYVAHYTAAKHALVGFTRAIAAELEGSGVTASAICPGYADTPLTARSIANVRERTGLDEAGARAAILKSAGQRRLVTPAEVAEAVLACCTGSENGAIVVLTGAAAEELPLEIVNPPALGAPRGWNHGLIAPPGARVLFIAGQAGWDDGAPGTPAPFAAQFARALDKVLTVVREAGGEPHALARLTVYVSDVEEYRAARKELGALWRERLGTYYPAMALVQVLALADRGARVEIEATAVLGGTRP